METDRKTDGTDQDRGPRSETEPVGATTGATDPGVRVRRRRLRRAPAAKPDESGAKPSPDTPDRKKADGQRAAPPAKAGPARATPGRRSADPKPPARPAPAPAAAAGPAESAAPEVGGFTTFLQLEHAARQAPTVEALRFTMVNETRRLLPYRQAVFATGVAKGRMRVEGHDDIHSDDISLFGSFTFALLSLIISSS